MSSRQEISSRAVVGLIAALLGAVLAPAALAFNPQPDPPGQWRFGLVTLGDGQGVRINVVNLLVPAVQTEATTPQGHVQTPVQCGIEVSVVDAGAGELLPAVQKILGPGESLQVEWRFDPAAAPNGFVSLRPIVRTFCDGSVRPAFRRLGPFAPTLEVFDTTTGKTSFVLSAGLVPAVLRR